MSRRLEPCRPCVQLAVSRIIPCVQILLLDLLELAVSPAVASGEAGAQYSRARRYQVDSASGGSAKGNLSLLKFNGHESAIRPPLLSGRSDPSDLSSVGQHNAKPATTMLTQFQVLSQREFQNMRRDWSLIVMHNVVAALVGLFVGGMYFKVNTTISGFQVRFVNRKDFKFHELKTFNM